MTEMLGFTAVVLKIHSVSQLAHEGTAEPQAISLNQVIARLRRAGVHDIHLVTDSDGSDVPGVDEVFVVEHGVAAMQYVLRLREASPCPVLVVDARCILDWYLYANLALNPGGDAAVLGVRPGEPRPGFELKTIGSFVSEIRISTRSTQPCFAGVVRLKAGGTSDAALGVDRSNWGRVGELGSEEVPLSNVSLELLVILLDAGLDVRLVEPGAAGLAVVQDPESVVPVELLNRSEDEIDQSRMRDSVKVFDGVFTSYFISPWTQHLARASARRSLTPNQITTTSLLVALLAAVLLGLGTRSGAAVAAVLVIFAFGLDCVDGQLARYSWQFSARGAWLDLFSDRVKEVALIVGLIVGTGTAESKTPFVIGICVIALVGLRHSINTSYLSFERSRRRRSQIMLLPDRREMQVGAVLPVGLVGTPAPGPPRVGVFRRLMVFSIGERLAVIAFGSLAFGAAATLVALCVGQAVALVWQLSGRLARSLKAGTFRFSEKLRDGSEGHPPAQGGTLQLAWLTAPLWVGSELFIVVATLWLGGAALATLVYVSLLVVHLSNETFRPDIANKGSWWRVPIAPVRMGYVAIAGVLWPNPAFALGSAVLLVTLAADGVNSWRRATSG